MPVRGFFPLQRTVRCATSSLAASRLTAAASRRAPGRNPWSTVTAISFGPFFSRARQPAINSRRAVESGPPDTASTRLGLFRRSANNVAASAWETGSARSAADTLLFPLDVLLHAAGCPRIFPIKLAQGRASCLALAERRERLPEPQQRFRRFAALLEFGRNRQERFRGVAVALALVESLAQPVMRVGRESIAGVFLQEHAQAVLRQ